MRWWILLALAGCIGDSEPPELLELSPADAADLRGVGTVNVRVVFRDESPVTARFFVGPTFVGTERPSCGEKACTVEVTWSTFDFPPGAHDLIAVLEDEAGNVTTRAHQVWLDDVLEVTAMRVINILDESGTLEIEVYAYDEADTMIGCAGSRHGLGIVDSPGLDYSTHAVLITPNSEAFATREVGSGRFRLEVWEDDDGPVCPTPLDPLGNDFVGRSGAFTVDEWRGMPTTAFDRVTNIGLQWSRPLTETTDVDPDVPSNNSWGGDSGGGCQTSRAPAVGMLGLAAVLGIVRRRRRRQ